MNRHDREDSGKKCTPFIFYMGLRVVVIVVLSGGEKLMSLYLDRI